MRKLGVGLCLAVLLLCGCGGKLDERDLVVRNESQTPLGSITISSGFSCPNSKYFICTPSTAVRIRQQQQHRSDSEICSLLSSHAFQVPALCFFLSIIGFIIGIIRRIGIVDSFFEGRT